MFAPNGGIITLDEERFCIDDGQILEYSGPDTWVHDYKKIYMSNSYLKTWLDMTGDYPTGELSRSALWGVIQSKFYGEDKVLGVEPNKVVELCNDLSTKCTFAGVGLLLLGPTQPFAIGCIVSSLGGITTAIPLLITDDDYTKFSDTLRNALYNCQNDNISLSLEIYDDQTSTGESFYYGTREHVVKWSNWDKLYISKYEFENHRGTVFKFSDSPVYYDELILK